MPRTQMYSDSWTLVSASSLWMSQNSNGPKKIPVWPAQKSAEHDQRRPEHHEPEQKDRDLGYGAP